MYSEWFHSSSQYAGCKGGRMYKKLSVLTLTVALALVLGCSKNRANTTNGSGDQGSSGSSASGGSGSSGSSDAGQGGSSTAGSGGSDSSGSSAGTTGTS